MNKRTIDEMITYFNQEVSKMDISQENKIKLLGMITAIGLESKKQDVGHGEWIMFERPNGGYYKGCSLCTYPMPTDMELDYLCEEDNKYCYNCGARMDGKEKSK